MDFFVSPEWNQQVLDDNGNPAFGWKIYTYIAGSTTPIDTYTDATGNTTNPNPIVLPADGRYELWLEQDVAYKIVLTDENDVSRKTVDNVVGGIQGSGGGGLDFIAVAQSDTVSLDGLGTVALPLTATVNISSISSQAITITTGGIYARDYGIEISDLETAVANKLDKVQTAGQDVVSSVDFEKGIQLEAGYFGSGSPQLFFGTATDAYIFKQPNGDLVIINEPVSGKSGGLGIRTFGTSQIQADVSAGNNFLTITEGDVTTPAVMRFVLNNEGGGKEYFFDQVSTDNSPSKIYGRGSSGELVEVDPTFISSVAWGDITGNIANQPDVNLQSVTDNGPVTTNAIQTGDITVTSIAAGGESLKLPDFSWIQPLNSNTGLFITNHTSPNPAGGGSVHIDNNVSLYSGNGTVIQSQITTDSSGGVFLASYDSLGNIAANIQMAPNSIQILSQAGSQIIANASNLTLQGPTLQALVFNASSQAFLLDIPTGTPIQDPVESYYYYEDPVAGELKKTTFGVFKNLVQASDQSQTNFIAMSFTGGSGGTGSIISSDRMDIQSFGVMNILPGNVTPLDGQVLVYRTATGGLVYENQSGSSTDELVKVSATDASAGYLEDKLEDGSNINFTKLISSGVEKIRISSPSTTAGVLDTFFLTGDPITTTAGTFYDISNTDKGSVALVTQTVTNNDNQKSFYGQDYLSIPVTGSPRKLKAGPYKGSIKAQVSSNQSNQRWGCEIYLTDGQGVPEASGVTGQPVGDLGVQILAEIDSGIIDIFALNPTAVTLSGVLPEDYSIPVGKRLRLHYYAEKVGTAGGSIDYDIFSGQDANSFISIASAIVADDVEYDNVNSGLLADNVQDAIDEISGTIDTQDLQAVTNIGATTNIVTEFTNRLLVGGTTDDTVNALQSAGDLRVGDTTATFDTFVNIYTGDNLKAYTRYREWNSLQEQFGFDLYYDGSANEFSFDSISRTTVNNRLTIDRDSGLVSAKNNFEVLGRTLLGGATDDLVNSLQVDSSVRVGDTADTTDNFVNIYSGNLQNVGVKYREWNGANSFGFDTFYDGVNNVFRFDAVESNAVTGSVMALDRATRTVEVTNGLETPKLLNVPAGTIENVYGEDSSGNLVKGSGGGGSSKKFENVTYARAGLINGANVAFTTDAAFTNPHFYTSDGSVNWNLKKVSLNSAFALFNATNFDLIVEYAPIDTAWAIGSGTILHTESFTGVTKNVPNNVIQGSSITVAVPNNVNIFVYFKLNLGVYSMTDAVITLSLEEQ